MQCILVYACVDNDADDNDDDDGVREGGITVRTDCVFTGSVLIVSSVGHPGRIPG